MQKWSQFFGSLSEDQLNAVALLRVIECTNGCIQHTYRSQHSKSLTVEETRAAMKYSMAAMKNLSFQVGETVYSFEDKVAEGLREARELYVKAFKQGEEAAMDEFMDCSFSCAKTLGESRIRKAATEVRKNLGEFYPEHTVSWGENYLLNLLKDDLEEE